MRVITFHSLEDRMVKQRFVSYTKGYLSSGFSACVWEEQRRGSWLQKKPVEPSEKGACGKTARSRSAKLRIIEKIKDKKYKAKAFGPHSFSMHNEV